MEFVIGCGRDGGGIPAVQLRSRPRYVRRAGRRGVGDRFQADGEPCPLCGEEAPAYRVLFPDHSPAGCERCLLIYREGIVQL